MVAFGDGNIFFLTSDSIGFDSLKTCNSLTERLLQGLILKNEFNGGNEK